MARRYTSPFVKVAEMVCPAVITIVVTKDVPKVEGLYIMPFQGEEYIFPQFKGEEKARIGGGSGFIISEDGYILTCNHVVADPDADYTVIVSPEEKYPAKIVGRDPLVDIALLKIESAEKLPFLKLGDSQKIKLGEQVLAIGNPLGEFEDTLSAGIISGLSRKITTYGTSLFKGTTLRGLIQTDAAINPGNSGGPLVNMKGEAIGINTAMVLGAENIGFAIPINYGKKIYEEIKMYGRIKRPFLGVRYLILNEKISKINKLPVDYGALIVRESFGEPAIVPGSPAEKVGLKEYDIILEVNGEKITEDTPLADLLAQHGIGTKVNLKVWRGGKELNYEVELKEDSRGG